MYKGCENHAASTVPLEILGVLYLELCHWKKTPIPSPRAYLAEPSVMLLQFLDGGVGDLCQLDCVSRHLDAGQGE